MTWFSALPFPRRRLSVVLSALFTVAAGPLHAQHAPTTRAAEQDLPITLKAEEITGRPDRQLNLEHDVEVVRGQTRLTSDTACYYRVEDEVTASGHVQMWRFGDRYQGDALQLNLETGKGWLLHPKYHLLKSNAQGGATRMDFLSEDQAVITNGTYSTCEGPDPDWYLKSSKLSLDSGRDLGHATNTVIYFKGVPIIPAPALSFSLSGARRSGWLPPTIGLGSKGAGEIMFPYYFNIAPNRDLTVFPRLFFDRGLQMGGTFRYLGETTRGPYSGETHIEYLPNDRLAHRDRWWVDTLHHQVLAQGWSYAWNAHAASDDNYPGDFSRTVAASAVRQLLRELRTDYGAQYWSMSARVQSYQVLQDPASAQNKDLFVPRPYDRLPQLNFHAGRFDVLGGFDWSVDAEATRFSHPDNIVQGNRGDLVAQLSYPFVRPGYFVTPKAIVHETRYSLTNNKFADGTPAPNDISRFVPTFSLDSGLIFERDANLFGRAMTQTLEPRLFYVRTPFRDQTAIPVFDTGIAGFNYAQLFTENRFVGPDRVSDANQLTAAVVSRLLEPTGAERLRVALGSRLYFSNPRVQLTNEPRNVSRSDALFAASGHISDTWSFDTGVQYDAQGNSLYSSNAGVQWQPAPMKVLNAEYRYQRSSFRNVDLSGQWPLTRRWYGVGRVSYSMQDKKLLESLVGLEYKADCWVFRFGASRFVTAAQTTSTPVFFQLELNGLSRLGIGNPLESFTRSIPGYTRLNTNVGRP
ncbi:LPS-assembly protein LptD [Massilia horti]|uniref:LPS-assembly protein LptD n=1 Tax=Massilia horti TaxID=2562153 RepID=A0A4Y9SV67_9BURK|nr:LPS-assembly protein LptD [Massilia horti]TFW29397.1 LPS-assembly protein LptD [Massilia horti]